MASTISVALNSAGVVTATYDGDASSGDNTLTYNGMSDSGTYTASTAVPVTKFASYDLTLSSGTGSIDLTALPGITADETVVGTGLKLQVLKLRNKSTNANIITVTKGASNGYGLDASETSWTVVLSPGQHCLFFLNEAAVDISGTKKTMDVTGTGAQVLEVLAIMG